MLKFAPTSSLRKADLIKLSKLISTLLFFFFISVELDAGEKEELEIQFSQLIEKPCQIIRQLTGGVTNKAYLVQAEEDKFMVRLGRQSPEELGIDRESELLCHNLAAKHGIAPQIIYADPDSGTLVTEFKEGETLTLKKMRQENVRNEVIGLLKRCHKIPPDQALHLVGPYENICKLITRTRETEPFLLSPDDMDSILKTIEEISLIVPNKDYEGICHNDLNNLNFIESDGKIWIIDWEFAGLGNTLFDLAGYCVAQELNPDEIREVLQLYTGHNDSEQLIQLQLMCAVNELWNSFYYFLQHLTQRDDPSHLTKGFEHYFTYWKRIQYIQEIYSTPLKNQQKRAA
ncbi:MAG: thiamine kinase-like enzyme [Chlamydiales bacterium]|jgi:thiamine kinase-like enzyme